MAVVTKYTKGYPDPTLLSAYSRNSHEAMAIKKCSMFKFAVASGDTIASLMYAARIPSNAIILPTSTLYTNAGGIAGLTSLSAGLTALNAAGTTSANVLMDAVDVHTAGSFSMLSNVASADYLKRLWELLGLSVDPKCDVDVILKTGATTSGAGSLTGFIDWTVMGF